MLSKGQVPVEFCETKKNLGKVIVKKKDMGVANENCGLNCSLLYSTAFRALRTLILSLCLSDQIKIRSSKSNTETIQKNNKETS